MVVVVLVASSGWAGPVSSVAPSMTAPEPVDPAVRWTVATMEAPAFTLQSERTDLQLMPHVSLRSTVPSTWSPFDRVTGQADEAAADPTPYALLGAALLVAGLVARRWRARQRGFSKKT